MRVKKTRERLGKVCRSQMKTGRRLEVEKDIGQSWKKDGKGEKPRGTIRKSWWEIGWGFNG